VVLSGSAISEVKLVALLSNNALLTKVRLMYAKRLRSRDYEELFSCSDVNQISQILKSMKLYSSFIMNLNEGDVHRGVLESLLRGELFNEMAALAKYDLTLGEKLFEYVMVRMEVASLLKFLVFFMSGNAHKYVCCFPGFFEKRSKIDFKSFKNVSDYQSFLELIKSSAYYKMFSDGKGENLDMNKIEISLYSYLINTALNLKISRKFSIEIKKFYNSYIDLVNLVRIIRLRKFHNVRPNCVRLYFFDFGNIKTKELIDIYEDLNLDRVCKKISSIFKFKFSEDCDFDKIPKLMRYKWAHRKIFYSSSSPMAMMAYMFLKETEVSNIVKIIEGIRYKLPRSEFESMIIK
jgi:V/A-type H+-transporting ATPase subunit C